MKLNVSPVSLVVPLLVIAAGAYWYVSSGTGNELPLTASGPGGQAQTRFQTLVRELTPISFDTGIFSDPRFSALTDLTTPIVPESAGRLDPFAALTSAAAVPADSTSAGAKTR